MSKTALVKVLNDILLTLDKGENSVLMSLDLCAAFDMVDLNILQQRLESWVGQKGNVLEWFNLYLEERSVSVCVKDCMSRMGLLLCGVPQGSMLAPILIS